MSSYPESYLVQDLSEASWVSENGFEGYKCILRNSNMKYNLRIMDTDCPRVNKVLGGCRGKAGEHGANRATTVGVTQFFLTGNTSHGSNLRDKSRWVCDIPSLGGSLFRAAQLADTHSSVGFQRLRAAIHCHPLLRGQNLPAQSPAQLLGT